ncbi:hypothetical protein CIB48_g6167 [Xylaria polymorpha]|nr:hypothetical protein CIB48_g6167 [Xylaria polymorpha]
MRTSPYDTATNCDLCKLLTHVDSTLHFLHGLEFPTSIEVRFSRTYPGGQQGPITEFRLFNIDRGQAGFSIWVDEGNRDLGMSTERPIFTNNPYEAVPLISKWLRECMRFHNKCLQTVCGQTIDQGEYVTLPARVLSVTNLGHVKLLESHGLKGRYCALSHCWGSPDNQPLRTVKENFDVHLAGIPFSKLPKTFQEASIITRRVGSDYLWIDSLCIVQDDPDDWFREAQVMGSIYEKAIIVLSASGSSDSSGGCFGGERPEDTPTASIFVKPDYEHIIRLNLRLLSQSLATPVVGPLASRGWALQERYLARRKVFFMPRGISWACHTMAMDERSISADLGIYDYTSWPLFLEQYTRSKLTIVSDRLSAIQGIVTEMKKARKGQYFFGVWDTDLLGENWWSKAMANQPPARRSFRGLLPEEDLLFETNSGEPRCPYVLQDRSGQVLGLGVFDAQIASDCVFAFWASRRREIENLEDRESISSTSGDGTDVDPTESVDSTASQMEICYQPRDEQPLLRHKTSDQEPIASPSIDGANVDPTESTVSWVGICHQVSTDILRIMKDTIYHGLLLKPVDNSMTRFERVGMGVMYSPAFENEGLTPQDYEIV